MAIDLTPEQRTVGKENFDRVTGELTRRGFLKSMAVTAGVVGVVSPAVYFGYKAIYGNPVRTALIGCGDEGGVLAGAHNPDYTRLVAVCDIRPSNRKRIFTGDTGGAKAVRPGLDSMYKAEAKDIKVYSDYMDLLQKEKDLEAVIIALPLHLHAPVAIDVMKFGQQRGKPIHVLCEKLMAWNIAECKRMIKVAKETGTILSIGHQRHYSMLYAHAKEVLASGTLGDVKHIRALWHRNNSWPWSPNQATGKLAEGKDVNGKDILQPYYRDGWFLPIYEEDFKAFLEDPNKLKQSGFESIDELMRWRLYNETGGGLMAELGSHQLDACSIFLGKVKPLAVMGAGGKYFYKPGQNDRDSDDSVFVTYEFPGKNHPKGPNKGADDTDIVVVTYSSFNTNSFEAYGECVMGSRGTMVVEGEATVMLYSEKDPTKSVSTPAKATEMSVTTGPSGKPAVESGGTWGPPMGVVATGGAAGSAAAGKPPSRGYTEEMEDFAYCVREWDTKLGYEKDAEGHYRQRLPRCHGEVAMADAIVALTANHAMRSKNGRVDFKPEWFEADKAEVPDDPKAQPKVKPRLG
jgi:predicted dehydrogenase